MDNTYDYVMYPNDYNHYKMMNIYFWIRAKCKGADRGVGEKRTGTERNLTFPYSCC